MVRWQVVGARKEPILLGKRVVKERYRKSAVGGVVWRWRDG